MNYNINAIRNELSVALGRNVDLQKPIAIYGAGDTAKRNGDIFGPYKADDNRHIPVKFFIDDTPSKHNTIFFSCPVINFEEAHELCKGYTILVCSNHLPSRKIIFESLQKNPIENGDFMGLQEYIYCTHKDEVLQVFDMLEDELAKATYANMILTRMGKCSQDANYVRQNQYFDIPSFAQANQNEVYVDCGAFVGDTIEAYLFKKFCIFNEIYAFEPMNVNFQALNTRVRRLKEEWALDNDRITILHAGVGEKSYHIAQNIEEKQLKENSHAGMTLVNADTTVDHGIPVYSIDDVFKDKTISFLKVDIEGYERKMLEGAKQVIKRDKPKIAICIYHTPVDMFRLALKLKQICSEYKFVIRQHSFGQTETVLYAWVGAD